MVAHAERGLAAIRTMRADGGYVLHLPRTRLVTIGAAGERAHGTNIDAHAALFALQMIFVVGNDHRERSTLAYAECLHVHAFVANSDTTKAEDATRRVEIDQI